MQPSHLHATCSVGLSNVPNCPTPSCSQNHALLHKTSPLLMQPEKRSTGPYLDPHHEPYPPKYILILSSPLRLYQNDHTSLLLSPSSGYKCELVHTVKHTLSLYCYHRAGWRSGTLGGGGAVQITARKPTVPTTAPRRFTRPGRVPQLHCDRFLPNSV